MARSINRLTALDVKNEKRPGLHADGGGLYLSTTNGGRRWIFLYRWDGRRREMGLGGVGDVPLARARQLAAVARQQVAEGLDPLKVRQVEREAAAVTIPHIVTFGAFSTDYITSVENGWRNEKHRQQWRNSLRDHAAALAALPVSDINTDHLLAVLQPIWLEKPETASRVRGRIEKVLSAAKARGLRPRDSANPAQWKGHLDVLLPKRVRLSRGHHAAMPYGDVPQFMQRLADRDAMAAKALAFLILCASRSGEVLGARWGEIEGDVWKVPATRMKAGAPHTVTLTAPAVALLQEMGRGASAAYIFHGGKPDRMLSNMAMAMLMRRMGEGHWTVHGFRAAFKDWALNETDVPDEISEEALAHTVGSKVRRAYRRGEALERRRKLMERWSEHIGANPTLA